MLKIKRFANGTFRSEVSHNALEVLPAKELLTEVMHSFSFIIERNKEVSGDEFSDLILQYSYHPRAKFLAKFVRLLNKKNPEFVTLGQDGSLLFYGFSISGNATQDRLKEYFNTLKRDRFLSREDFTHQLNAE